MNRVRVGATPAGVGEAEIRSYGTLDPYEHYQVYADIDDAMHTLDDEDPRTMVGIGQVLVAAAGDALKNPPLAAVVALHVARLAYRARDFINAIFFSRKAELAVADEPDQAELLFEARYSLAQSQLRASRYHEAEETARNMLSMPLLENDPMSAVTANAMLAEALNGLRKYAEAVETLKRVQALITDVDAELACSSRIGKIARAGGNHEEAMVAFNTGRNRALETERAVTAATFLSEIGMTWMAMGEEQRGIAVLVAAAKEAEAEGDTESARRWLAVKSSYDLSEQQLEDKTSTEYLVAASSAFRISKDFTKAREMALEGIRQAINERDQEREAEGRNILSAIYAHEGAYGRSVAAAEAALRIAEQLDDKMMLVRFLGNAGISYMNWGQAESSEAALRRAFGLGRELLETASTSEFRQAILGGMASTLSNLALLLLRNGRAEELIGLGQQARATNAAGWMAAMSEVQSRDEKQLIEPLLRWRGAEARLESRAIGVSRTLVGDMDAQKRARDRFRQAAVPPVAVRAPQIPFAEVAGALREDECLIDLFVAEMGVIVTAVGSNGSSTSTLAGWEAVNVLQFLDRWQSAVAEGQTGPGHTRRGRSGQRRRKRKGASIADLVLEMRERLGSVILTAAREVVPAMRRMIVVPHRETGQLPFWCLVDDESDLRVSVAPGANVAVLLRRRLSPPPGRRIAIGDVTGTLDFAEPEIEALPGFTNVPAYRESLLDEMANAQYIHFAGHAVFNAQNPYLSGLTVLSRDRLKFLTVLDLLAGAWLANVSLTVLSGCSTGLPRRHPASEFIGLPAAFQIAGCRNVIGSLWPVDDRPTSILMRELYDALAVDGGGVVSPSMALATARRRLAGMTRAEVVSRLGTGQYVPETEYPYAAPQFTHAFQHYGVD